MNRGTLRTSLYLLAGVLVLALTGLFTLFDERAVVKNGLNLSTILLIVVFVGTGYLLARRAGGGSAAVISGVLGSLIVGGGLALLVLFQQSVDTTFVFPNFQPLLGSTVTFGQTETATGIIALLLGSAGLGALGGGLTLLPPLITRAIVISLAFTVFLGLLENQIRNILTLPDALALTAAFAAGYITSLPMRGVSWWLRAASGLAAGALVGILLSVLAGPDALATGGWLRGSGSVPVVLSLSTGNNLLLFAAVFGVAGLLGGLATTASQGIHNGAVYFVTALILIGILNGQQGMTTTAAFFSVALMAVVSLLLPSVSERLDDTYEAMPRPQKREVQRLAFVVVMLVLLAAPTFMGQYITNVVNLVGLYIIMGIGLNIVVGNAGLLDLGYVAFFAIGAYAIGLLTTPSLLTCGGVAPDDLTPETIGTLCTGVMSFWQAWPLAVLASALFGVLLGVPVLRLRGDYLAIVTLGFGEIIRILVKFDDFKPLFGAAQGIANIPRPVIDLTALNPAWLFTLDTEAGIYYLVLAGVLLTALVASRLSTTALGRAWRAMRADEDVAQAMGINLTRTKLLAFAIGAAFAGMGGAIAGTRLYGAYPDSFTLQVSINVLSLIIIGGLGSIQGVIIGSLVLIGLPEVLRELADYRLLAFGSLLVVAMLLKPEGLLPPGVRRLSEDLAESRARRGASDV